MDLVTDILIGISLAMDCSAVSMAAGANTVKSRLPAASLLAALFFGGFQAAMLFVGGLGGSALKEIISGIDHWIAFGLLALVGGKMILESRQAGKEERVNLLDLKVLLLLSVATSIDALAVGAGLAFANEMLIETALIAGATTAAISLVSVFAGDRFGTKLEGRAEIVGGILLVLIGLNILRSHLSG